MTRSVAENRVVVRGAGEMASGVIHRLVKNGFEVIALEQPAPACVRRLVCFAEAFFIKEVTVAGVTAVLVNTGAKATAIAGDGRVPLLIDPEAKLVPVLAPLAVIDGRMLKQGTDSDLNMAPIVIGLGPGFVAPENCHAAIETNRGSDLGRIFYSGSPQADTGVPAPVSGFSSQRVLRSPADGEFTSCCRITDRVESGQVLGKVGGVEVVSEIDGIVRGMIHDGLMISRGQKIGDVDPRGIKEHCYRISNKAGAIGEAVVEALTTLKTRITHC
ncbi:MAG: selenium-dependent molybdenum cofactor biosynthesis protein YqeB [bacterium]